VIHVADLVLVILTPGSGDDIQAFKAGIMEIADIFVINKSDVAGASALEAQIRSMVELGDPGGIAPSIFRTSAAEDRGIEPLGEEVLKRVRV
jgi:LAO/AO transport system kinase